MSGAPAIISRKDAKAGGLTRYYTGLACPNGHVAKRFVSGWACTACKVPKTRVYKHRVFAKSQGATIYFTGIPCRNGHVAERFVANGRCTTCFNEWAIRHQVAAAQSYNANREAINQRLRDSRTPRPKAAAKKAGLLHYFTGVPCCRNHIDYRRVSNGLCLSCSGMPQAEWAKKNPEASRVSVIRNRARRRGATGSHTASQIKTLKKLQKDKCGYCKTAIKKRWHVDHINALSKGGSNSIANIQLLCPPCNQRKNAKDPLTFARELGLLL